MTREELVEASGVSMRTLGNIERGVTTPQPKVLERILRALGLSPRADEHIAVELEILIGVITPYLATLDEAARGRALAGLITALVNEMRSQMSD